jgi:hypothetical protein
MGAETAPRQQLTVPACNALDLLPAFCVLCSNTVCTLCWHPASVAADLRRAVVATDVVATLATMQCQVCGKPARLPCPGCAAIYYCSDKHLDRHSRLWKHPEDCRRLRDHMQEVRSPQELVCWGTCSYLISSCRCWTAQSCPGPLRCVFGRPAWRQISFAPSATQRMSAAATEHPAVATPCSPAGCRWHVPHAAGVGVS